jgi:hypothetical protein
MTTVNEYLNRLREAPILLKRQKLHDSMKYQYDLEAKRQDDKFKDEFERRHYLQTQYSSKVYTPNRDALAQDALNNGNMVMLRALDMTRESANDHIQLAMIDMVQ